MALALQIKKGGRHTKKVQEDRRLQVYDLYFEQKKSAVEIAKILDVHRNTVNEDIKFWRNQIVSEIDPQNIISKVTKQVQRWEIQWDRLMKDLEFADNIDDRAKLEKLLGHVGDKLYRHYSKNVLDKKETDKSIRPEEIGDEITKEFVRWVIFSDESYEDVLFSEDNLKFYFIKRTKCNISYAESVIEKMKQDGLTLCQVVHNKKEEINIIVFSDFSAIYNLGKFASLRSYATEQELTDNTLKNLRILKEMN